MKKFFKDKKNLILVIAIGVAILSIILSSFIAVLTPFSYIICGLTCIYGAYMLLLKYVKIKNDKTSEFINEENPNKRRMIKFVEAEGRSNVVIFIILCAFIGGFLIYFGFLGF